MVWPTQVNVFGHTFPLCATESTRSILKNKQLLVGLLISVSHSFPGLRDINGSARERTVMDEHLLRNPEPCPLPAAVGIHHTCSAPALRDI